MQYKKNLALFTRVCDRTVIGNLNYMSTEVFDLYIQKSLEKLESLWRRSSNLPTSEDKSSQTQQLLLEESLTELTTSIEELQIACETLRQQNEELLEDRQKIISERQFYQQLFDSAPECYLVTTKEGTIKEANWQAAKLLGVSSQYLIRKSLTVFIALEDRQQYYSKLNQVKKGKVSKASWHLKIINRQQDVIPVECAVDLIDECFEEATNLRWRISFVKPQSEKVDIVNSTSMLINSLRSPLHDLLVQIEELKIENKINQYITNSRWQAINKQAFGLQNIVNNGYIINHVHSNRNLNLSLIDYSIFIPHLIYKVNNQNIYPNYKTQIIVASSKNYFSGISDSFLLKQIIHNILNKNAAYVAINSIIRVKLTKNFLNKLIIKIEFLLDERKTKQWNKTFYSPIVSHQIDSTFKDWEIAVICKSISFLKGSIKLSLTEDNNATISVRLPLVLNIDG